ncbi:MAG: galactosyldiacylglycerol synthase [Acidobacteriia bacterium]|nr:galactosyldiacylglycerol synthase [Terriglobia bacterium]
MQRITFVYFDAGGGHRSAMDSLLTVIERQKRPWDISTLNLQEVLDRHDFVRRLTGLRVQDVYNRMLASGWTLGTPQLLWALHGAIRVLHNRMVSTLAEYWRNRPAEVVVSVISNFNRELAASVKLGLPGAKFVAVMTDIADYPARHIWIVRELEYLVCGSERAAEQARQLGHGNGRVFRTSGMILNPRFYESRNVERGPARQRLGLDPDCPTALVLFGGQGSNDMLEIARRLEHYPGALQFIFICGRNKDLATKLRGMRTGKRRHIEGFTFEIPYFMRLADFFIGKPGPGCVSEALSCGLPVIVECNAWTLPQERYNAEWIQNNGYGIMLRSFDDINRAVTEMLEPGAMYPGNVAQYFNCAVFEVIDILQQIIDEPHLPASGTSDATVSPSSN